MNKLESLAHPFCCQDHATMHCPIGPPDPALPKYISLARELRSKWDQQFSPLILSTFIIFTHIKHFSESKGGTQGKGRGVKSNVWDYVCRHTSCHSRLPARLAQRQRGSWMDLQVFCVSMKKNIQQPGIYKKLDVFFI